MFNAEFKEPAFGKKGLQKEHASWEVDKNIS